MVRTFSVDFVSASLGATCVCMCVCVSSMSSGEAMKNRFADK